MIQISHATRQLVIRYEPRFAALFPHGRLIDFEGERMIVVPHGIDETKLLRNLDWPVPSPIEEHYDFPSVDGKRPFTKQVLTCVLMTMNRNCFVLNDMGTGKTKSAIWAFDFLRRAGKARRMLVVAPLSTVRFTWEREIFNTLPNLSVAVLTGTADRRRKLLAEKHDVYIINHDGVKVIFPELKLRHDIDIICF